MATENALDSAAPRIAASSTIRWPNRSAAAPSSGPPIAPPIPTTAELIPPRATESRAATTSVSVPTTIMANGNRAKKAMGKYANPVAPITVVR